MLLAVLLVVGACGAQQDSASGDDVQGPVRILNASPPGGVFDIVLRGLQSPLEDELGTNIIQDNIEGGAGSAAVARLKAEPADGSTMMITSRTISSAPYTGAPEVDPLNDFAPVSVVVQDVSGLSVAPDAPYGSVSEFVEYAREHPGEIQVGTSGQGSVWHAAGLLLAEETGIDLQFIPYDGGSEAANALASGEVEAVTVSPAEIEPFVEDGTADLLSVMGEERHPLFPDVPTLREEGVDEVYTVWRGLVAKEGTPDDLLSKLEESVQTAVESQEFEENMDEAGIQVSYQDSGEFQEILEEEDEQVQDLLERNGLLTSRPER